MTEFFTKWITSNGALHKAYILWEGKQVSGIANLVTCTHFPGNI